MDPRIREKDQKAHCNIRWPSTDVGSEICVRSRECVQLKAGQSPRLLSVPPQQFRESFPSNDPLSIPFLAVVTDLGQEPQLLVASSSQHCQFGINVTWCHITTISYEIWSEFIQHNLTLKGNSTAEFGVSTALTVNNSNLAKIVN